MRCLIILLILSMTYDSDKVSLIEYKVIIQPLGKYEKTQVDFVVKKLRQSYKNIEVRPALPLPDHTFNKSKSRHRAPNIIAWLNQLAGKNESIIGITSQDISTTKGSKEDYGIMGLAFCPGVACVASSYRLNKKNVNEQLFKIVIHEHGHNLGLQHCPAYGCYMKDAKGKNHTDGLFHFCANCSREFSKNNWDIKKL
jgi:archaemetzincin